MGTRQSGAREWVDKVVLNMFRQRAEQRTLNERIARAMRMVGARHSDVSLISSVDDLHQGPDVFLVDLLIRSAQCAATMDISALAMRTHAHPDEMFVETWPGEHYKLLPSLCRTLGARRVVEVGTYKGHATLALALSGALVTTYDVIPLGEFSDAIITLEDLNNGIEQRIGDLSDDEYFESQRDTLLSADLIFVDGPKDGRFEEVFAARLYPALAGTGRVVVWDDIRLLSMVGIWRHFPVPKLDATSFGHWSGTGLTHCV